MNHVLAKVLPSFIYARLAGRHNLQRILSNTLWLFADRVLRLGVGLLVGVWVARYLGPEQFGLYNYAIAFVTFFGAIASLGLDGIVVRDIVRDPSIKEETLGTAFVLKLVGGVLAIFLTLAGIFLLRPGDTLAHWLVGIVAVVLIFQAFDVIDFWFQSQVQSKYTVYARSVAFALIALVRVGLILIGAPLIAFVWAGTIEIGLGAVGLVVAYRLNGHYMRAWRSTVSRARSLLKDSWPLVLSSVMVTIYMRIDQVLIGQLVGNSEVGVYSAAVRLSEVWYFIPIAIVASTFPSVVEAKKVSDTLFYERLQKLYNLMALLGYAIAIPMTFMAGWLVQTLYGSAYSRAAPMLVVLVWSIVFTNLGVARGSFLTTMNWTKIYFMTVFMGFVINLALNLWLVPIYGGLGAAIASLVAYWFAAHGSCFLYKPLFRTGIMLTKAMVYPRV